MTPGIYFGDKRNEKGYKMLFIQQVQVALIWWKQDKADIQKTKSNPDVTTVCNIENKTTFSKSVEETILSNFNTNLCFPDAMMTLCFSSYLDCYCHKDLL